MIDINRRHLLQVLILGIERNIGIYLDKSGYLLLTGYVSYYCLFRKKL